MKIASLSLNTSSLYSEVALILQSPIGFSEYKTLTPLQCLSLTADSLASQKYSGLDCVAVVITSKTLGGLSSQVKKLSEAVGINTTTHYNAFAQLEDWEREKFLNTPAHKGVFLSSYNGGQAFSFNQHAGLALANNTAENFSPDNITTDIKNRASEFMQTYPTPQPKTIGGLSGVYAKALGVANAETHAAKIKSDEGLPVAGYVYSSAFVFIAPSSDITPIKQAFSL